jgi:hypothetical protein
VERQAALTTLNRRAEVSDLFETLLARGNRHGMLAEHLDPKRGEQ